MHSYPLVMANTPVLMSAGFCLLGAMLVYFFARLYYVRRDFRNLQRQGLPMPPHHPVFGHLLLVASIVKSLPTDVSQNYLPESVRLRYPYLDEAFYLDLWPISPRILMVYSPEMMRQFTQDHVLPKHYMIMDYLEPITGRHNLVAMNGPLWKEWRAKFNPGFSAGQVMSFVPAIVEQVVIFRNLLRERASEQNILHLEDLTLNFSIDVIGKVVLDHGFHQQKSSNQMASTLLDQLTRAVYPIGGNPLENMNFYRLSLMWYNDKMMHSYLSKQLDLRYSNIRTEDIKGISIVDQALKSHHASNSPGTEKTTAETSPLVDRAFKDMIINQIRILFLAGHDTTSASIVYTYHFLFKNPSALALIREEHNKVFGPDVNAVPAILASTPHVINDMPYTLAVFKETLRLFPPAAASREGEPGFFLSSPSFSARFPTEGCLVWGSHYTLFRNSKYWVRPDEFLPERWLVGEDDPLYPIKDAWRPFEMGPRRCIGQELAITEMKIVLALTVREFNIVEAYEEWDVKKGTPERNRAGVNGERVYQILRGGAHPSEFYPCRVERLVS